MAVDLHPESGRFQIMSCPSRATSIEMGMLTNNTLHFIEFASPRKCISEEERYYILMNDYKDIDLFFLAVICTDDE